ncbi:LOB domain-containing protein 20-like [Phragmites australis]|uniref:LOB domain-containing protein 20-like n=1 Tax=Phragmites australis TaxID=29695 RepID=UPI002D786FA2|nr:LOB domain-containing protein 20-like [Phragmites australis]
MTTSASSPATAPSHVPDLHINTTGASSITSLSSHHHHPYPTPTARSPHSTSGSPRSSGGGTGSSGGSGSTNQACAACKYQRRKCNPDCPLAPYFPADQQRRFLNAHRLFGVSNILKTLRRLRPELCPEAMGTLIYQAEMRAQDPVGGCYRFILSLERQLEIETAELSAVLHHLALYRQAADATAIQPPPGGMANLDVTSSNQPLLLNAEQEVVDALYTNHEADAAAILQPDHRPHDQGHSPQDQQHQQQLFDYFYYDATASDDASSKPTTDINLEGMQQFDFDAADQKVDLAPPAVQEGQGLAQQIDVNCQIDQKDYEIKAATLVDVFNMQQELQEVDVNANIGVNAVDVNPGVAVKHELQDEGARNNISAGEAAQKAAESSQCKLGLGFSSF